MANTSDDHTDDNNTGKTHSPDHSSGGQQDDGGQSSLNLRVIESNHEVAPRSVALGEFTFSNSGRASDRDVNILASEALRILANRLSGERALGNGARALQKETLESFCSALIHSDDGRVERFVADLIQGGVQPQQLCDQIIPDAARDLGQKWVDDQYSFIDVTIGSARLQDLLRAYALSHYDHQMAENAPKILLATPFFEDHTLGSMVAADQLRRAGLRVHLGVCLTQADILDLISEADFQMICLSVARLDALPRVAELVDGLKTHMVTPIPISLSGYVLAECEDVALHTGADLILQSADEVMMALDHLGQRAAVEDIARYNGNLQTFTGRLNV